MSPSVKFCGTKEAYAALFRRQKLKFPFDKYWDAFFDAFLKSLKDNLELIIIVLFINAYLVYRNKLKKTPSKDIKIYTICTDYTIENNYIYGNKIIDI